MRRNRLLAILLELVLLVILCFGAYLVTLMDKYQHKEIEGEVYVATRPKPGPRPAESKSPGETGVADETEGDSDFTDSYTNRDKYLTIALIGVDARDNTTLTSGVNSDVIVLCSINKKTGDVKLASILRDTWVKMYKPSHSGATYDKINAALASHDIAACISTINLNFDLDITEYVVVNWAAVATTINMLGGVEANITQALIDKGPINSYITEVVKSTGIGSHQIWKPGVYNLDGVQAVAYCRIRYVGDDMGRSDKHREIIAKILEKTKHAGLGTVINIVNQVLPNVATSLSKLEILKLATDAKKLHITGTEYFPKKFYSSKYVGSIPQPDPMVAHDFPGMVKSVHQLLYPDIPYEPSETIYNIANHITKISGIR